MEITPTLEDLHKAVRWHTRLVGERAMKNYLRFLIDNLENILKEDQESGDE